LTLWVCKTGNRGQREERIIENSVLGIGWEDLGDLSKIRSRSELKALYSKYYPDASTGRMNNHVGQILSFLKKTKVGDTVVIPLKLTRKIAVGKIVGDYVFREDLGADMKHTMPVEWKRKDIPRSNFDQDLLYSFGAYMTFCEAHARNAEKRVLEVVEGKIARIDEGEEEEKGVLRDIEDESVNQIIDYISKKFKGHEFAALIASILKAQGFNTKLSPPGPDGGVDITASKGALGLLEPRICVQVKSSESTVGTDVYSQLKGKMSSLGATHGLLVSWGGFKKSIESESKNDTFKVKLWGPQEVLEQLFEVYPSIDSEIQASLPLKRIWALSTTEV